MWQKQLYLMEPAPTKRPLLFEIVSFVNSKCFSHALSRKPNLSRIHSWMKQLLLKSSRQSHYAKISKGETIWVKQQKILAPTGEINCLHTGLATRIPHDNKGLKFWVGLSRWWSDSLYHWVLLSTFTVEIINIRTETELRYSFIRSP